MTPRISLMRSLSTATLIASGGALPVWRGQKVTPFARTVNSASAAAASDFCSYFRALSVLARAGTPSGIPLRRTSGRAYSRAGTPKRSPRRRRSTITL